MKIFKEQGAQAPFHIFNYIKKLKVMLDKHTIERIEGIIHTQSLLNLKESLTTIIQDMIGDGFDEEDIFEYIKGIVIDKIEDADWE